MGEKKGQISVRKILVALLSLAMIVGFVLLFISASNNKKEGDCKGVVIKLKRDSYPVFVDTSRVRAQLLTHQALNPIGRPLISIDIPSLEQLVDKQDWVKSSEVYLGNHNLLHIKINQRVPVARVFTKTGSSFYLDDSGHKIPVEGKFTIKLPVFTGYSKADSSSKDSALLSQIKTLSMFIAGDHFWKAQVDQININAKEDFEIIPRVGDVLIIFGKGERVSEKFGKLMTFYKEGLNRVGWGYYDTIDLQYEGQVVASRKTKDGNPVINALVRHNDSTEQTTEL